MKKKINVRSTHHILREFAVQRGARALNNRRLMNTDFPPYVYIRTYAYMYLYAYHCLSWVTFISLASLGLLCAKMGETQFLVFQPEGNSRSFRVRDNFIYKGEQTTG